MTSLELRGPREPFIIRMGDVFGDRRGIDKNVRVILGLGTGTVGVSAAIPAFRDGVEYFSAVGGGHLLTEVRPVLERWDIDRTIAAYREGVKIQYAPLPAVQREELIRDFIGNIHSTVKERLVTVTDLEAAEAYERKQPARWVAMDEEFELLNLYH